MVERLAQEGIPLELCPWSNVLTQAVPDVASHPFKALMDAGVKTTLNTDDPGVMDLTLMDECLRATTEMGLTLDDLKQCNQWAAEASFIPRERLAKVWPSDDNSHDSPQTMGLHLGAGHPSEPDDLGTNPNIWHLPQHPGFIPRLHLVGPHGQHLNLPHQQLRRGREHVVQRS